MKKTEKNIILFLLLFGILLPAISAKGQQLVRGTVVAASDKLPVPGVSVVELDKNNRILAGVTTNAEGKFALKIQNSQNSISFSFIGYKTLIEPIGNRTVIDVSLEESSVELGTVEVVGKPKIGNGFMDVDERDLTTAVRKINTKELEDLPAVSIDEAIQGRIAGMDIVANSGDPGSGSTIRIRGAASLSGSIEPLIVIDDIPQQTKQNINSSEMDAQGLSQLLNIPIDDIKDIVILTDAAATAIYGSQASNGVLLITTKRGSVGKVSINYNFKYTTNTEPSQIPMLNGAQYATLIPELYMNTYNYPLPVTSAYKEFQNDPSDYYYYYNYNKNTDWLSAITQIGYSNDHNLSLTGGGEKAKYRASINYLGQQGNTVGTFLKRITTRLNIDYFISDKLQVSADIGYSNLDNDKSYETKKDVTPRSVAMRKMPNMSIYEYNVDGELTPNFFSPEYNVQGGYPNTYNPVALTNLAEWNVKTEKINPVFRLKYRAFPWLTYNIDISYDISSDKDNRFMPQSVTGRPSTNTSVNETAEYNNQSYTIYTKNRLSFIPKLGEKHSLITALAFTTNEWGNYQFNTVSSNTASSELTNPVTDSRIQNNGKLESYRGEGRSMNAVFSSNYSLLDRYIFAFSLLLEGNNKFGDNYMYTYFPSGGLKWRISSEKFMSKFTFIDEWSIWVNTGISGNDFTLNQSKYNIYYPSAETYLNEVAILPTELGLDNIRWEKKIERSIGTRMQVFKDRLGFDITYFNYKIQDGFRKNTPIPQISGYNDIDLNFATANNLGWETSIHAVPVKTKNWTVNCTFNAGSAQFILRNISSQYNFNEAPVTPGNGVIYDFIQKDKPTGGFYGFKREYYVYPDKASTIAKDKTGVPIYDAQGNPLYMTYDYPRKKYVFQPGDAKYVDINHDGTINYMDIVYLGSKNPWLVGGFGFDVAYKSNLRLSMFFNYRYDVDIANMTKMRTENMSTVDNQNVAVLRRWRNIGDKTDVPRGMLGDNSSYNWLFSDRYVEDGSFVRLRNLTLSYSVPKKHIEKVGMTMARLSVTLYNLYTLTNYTGQNPEVGSNGLDEARTPVPIGLMFGVSVGF
jgi:TonB-linked SusC/RagA family outer membrane protein